MSVISTNPDIHNKNPSQHYQIDYRSTPSLNDEPQQKSLLVPTELHKKPGLDDDLNELINRSDTALRLIQNSSTSFGNLFGDSSVAIGKIFNTMSSWGDKFLVNIFNNPKLLTPAIGLGGIGSGIFAVNNFIKAFRAFVDPKSSPAVPWLLYALQGVLEGGLSLGLTAPFFNLKNPFQKTINGKNVVQLKSIAGAALGPVLVSTFISMAQNQFFLTRIPIIGSPLRDICSSIAKGLTTITSNTGEQNQMSQNSPELAPSIP